MIDFREEVAKGRPSIAPLNKFQRKCRRVLRNGPPASSLGRERETQREGRTTCARAIYLCVVPTGPTCSTLGPSKKLRESILDPLLSPE